MAGDKCDLASGSVSEAIELARDSFRKGISPEHTLKLLKENFERMNDRYRRQLFGLENGSQILAEDKNKFN